MSVFQLYFAIILSIPNSRNVSKMAVNQDGDGHVVQPRFGFTRRSSRSQSAAALSSDRFQDTHILGRISANIKGVKHYKFQS
jgi:hypothetical protein